LKPVDVILGASTMASAIPSNSSPIVLGVAGLIEAVRAGNVTVANALGSGPD